MDYRLPIPKNWQDFESICQKLWSEIWNDPNCQKNGRQGQSQNGVDIFGMPIYSNEFAGVQCKDKDEQLGSYLSESDLTSECKKAINFKPTIASFTIATTSARDAVIQEKVREINTGITFPFDVQVWSWDDIQSEIIYRPMIMKSYFQDFNFIADEKLINLNRFTPKDRFHAFFSRPAVKESIPKSLKEYLITLGYELSDNAYKYGKAKNFKIQVNDNEITFLDDGLEFNPITQLDPTLSSLESHIGSFVLHSFLKKHKDNIEAKYERIKIDELSLNSLSIKTPFNFEELNKNDFLEIYVDWRQTIGRQSAIELAASMEINKDIKEVIWTVTDGFAASFSGQFITSILARMNSEQKFIISLPRGEIYNFMEDWTKDDERVIIQRR